MSVNVESNIVEFQRMFQRYTELNSRAPEELMEKKGRALGIALFQGFDAKKFGGPGKKKHGLARAQLDERTADGRGTKVRPSLLDAYKSERAAFGSSIRSLGQLARNEIRSTQYKQLRAESRMMRKKRAGLWNRVVSAEVKARQAGIGMLAASFLWYRKRQSQAKGTYIVPNRTGKPLGYVERGEGFFRIVSEAEGIDVVDARYGIVQAALQRETADMAEYIAKKELELFGVAFQK